MSTNNQYRHPANPQRVAAMHGLRTSNAAGTHAQGAKRERARRDAIRAAIKRETA
jgi:hypothetical protein